MEYQKFLKDRIEKMFHDLGEKAENIARSNKLCVSEGRNYPATSNFTIESYHAMISAIALMKLYNEQFGDDEDIKELEQMLSADAEETEKGIKRIFFILKKDVVPRKLE